MKPFFSIIIPTYNSALTIANCLNSIFTQSFVNFEILVIDGQSTDNTLENIFPFNDNRLKILSESDEGIYDAMNKGINLAKGKWLLFLGSDDVLFNQNVLNDVFNLMIDNEFKFVYGNVLLLGDTGWGIAGQCYDGEFDIEKLLKSNIAHQSIFYHNEVFKKHGNFDTKFKICADYDFNLRMAANYELKFIDKIISKFSAGGASTNAVDVEFGKLYINNIFKYFGLKLLDRRFSSLRNALFSTGKGELKKFRIVRGGYLILIGLLLSINNFYVKAYRH